MQKAATRIGMDQTSLVDAILRGLKPAIRLHVLHAEIKTDDILHHAKILEAAYSANAHQSDPVDCLAARVETLIDKPSANKLEDAQATPKKVTFSQSTVENAYEGRHHRSSPSRSLSPVDDTVYSDQLRRSASRSPARSQSPYARVKYLLLRHAP